MALYDHRVFRLDEEWWAAQVHSGTGGGSGTGPWRITEERVIFTNLSEEHEGSRTAKIPAGFLNRISHASLLELLDGAEALGSRFEMWPYNTPNEEEFQDTEIITDEEGMRWGLKSVSMADLSQRSVAADMIVDVVCLDDSALKRSIIVEAKSFGGNRGESSIVAKLGKDLVHTVKSSFVELG